MDLCDCVFTHVHNKNHRRAYSGKNMRSTIVKESNTLLLGENSKAVISVLTIMYCTINVPERTTNPKKKVV